jgi:transcriptional regulator with XRE-family HTH domain
MATIYSLIKAQQEQAAVEFGRMLRRWRMVNGWTQYTAKRWSDEAGLETVIRSSGLSELERGITRNPRSVVFLSLANLNSLIHHKQFKGVHTRDLLDQLKGSRAICDESSGEPWGPKEFFACHAGILPAPAWLAPPPTNPAPTLTDDQANELCASWADQAREATRAAGAGPAGLMAAGSHAPARLRQRWQGVVMGLDSWSPEELRELWDPEASEWQPAQWLTAWRDALGSAPSGGGGADRSSELIGA